MYPLLARRSHLAAYLLLWLFMGVLLSALLTTQGRFPWTLALVIGVPSAIAYSFICLSAWYVARAMPLESPAEGGQSLFELAPFHATVHSYVYAGNAATRPIIG